MKQESAHYTLDLVALASLQLRTPTRPRGIVSVPTKNRAVGRCRVLSGPPRAASRFCAFQLVLTAASPKRGTEGPTAESEINSRMFNRSINRLLAACGGHEIRPSARHCGGCSIERPEHSKQAKAFCALFLNGRMMDRQQSANRRDATTRRPSPDRGIPT